MIEVSEYVPLLSPAVIALSVVWFGNVIHRHMGSSSRVAGNPTPAGSTPPRAQRKVRNEFMARPGHRTLLSTKWIDAHDSKGWIVLMGVLVFTYLVRVFYNNAKLHRSMFSIEGSNFLNRIFRIEISEFLTVILVIYFFWFFAFATEWVMVRFTMARRGRLIMHAVAHVVMAAFIGIILIYLLQRRYDVSISYRFAVAAQLMVGYMKSVSYLGTNYYLWQLVSGDPVHADLVPLDSNMDIEKLTTEAISAILTRRGIDCMRLNGADAKKILTQLVGLDEYRKSVYPKNITLINYIEFSCLPVLVYEPRYPRSTGVNFIAVIEKLFIGLGLFMFDWFLVEHYIMPAVGKVQGVQGGGLFEVMLDLAVPMQMFFITTFYLVFECLLGIIAEVLRLADREFYADWWNSTTFEEFSRKWNKPVHEFLLRHVHMEAQSFFGFKPQTATVITFLWSIVAHEIVLLGMFGMFRPYLGFFSLFQIPLWHCMRSPVFRNKLLGNIIFWASLTIAYPLIIVMYCRDYCTEDVRNCRLS